MEKIVGTAYSSKKLGISRHKVRFILKSGKASFGIAYKNKGSSQDTYYIDKEAVDKCASGKLPIFKS